MSYNAKYARQYIFEAGSYHHTLSDYFDEIIGEKDLEARINMCKSVDYILGRMKTLGCYSKNCIAFYEHIYETIKDEIQR